MKSQYSPGDLTALAREHAQSPALHEMVASEKRDKPVGVAVVDRIEQTQGGIATALARIENALDRLHVSKPHPALGGNSVGVPDSSPQLIEKVRRCADTSERQAEWAHRLAARIEEVV